MQDNNHHFELTKDDQLVLNSSGARIVKLILGGVLVIQALPPFDGLGSGSYLMYPWVNRLEKQHAVYKSVQKDGKGLPIHGLVTVSPMNITHQKHDKIIKIVATPVKLQPSSLPAYSQHFILQPGKLTVSCKVQSNPNNEPVCFGFHPYLQIDSHPLKTLKLTTNIKHNIKLNQNSLLPVYPFVETEVDVVSDGKYDHLFQHTQQATDGYLRLSINGDHQHQHQHKHKHEHEHQHHGKGKQVEIRSSDMKYWQIYTPPDGKRIAVEPMTFVGNLYSIYSEEKYGKLPLQGSFTITVK